MTDYKTHLIELNKNLRILKERQAKYGGNEPLDLIHQISDHQTAIDLTKQVIAGQLSEVAWREAMTPLLVAIEDRSVKPECQVAIGSVGRDIVNSVWSRRLEII